MGAVISKVRQHRNHRTHPGHDFQGKSVFGQSMARTAEWEQMKKQRRASMGHQLKQHKGAREGLRHLDRGHRPTFVQADFGKADEKKDAEDENPAKKGSKLAAAANPNKQMAVLHAVMRDNYECRLFRLFLETEFCSELLDFAISIDRFESVASISLVPTEATPEMCSRAETMYARFLAPDAEDLLDLKSARSVKAAIDSAQLTNQSFVGLRAEAVALRESPAAGNVSHAGLYKKIKELLFAISDFEHHDSQAPNFVDWLNFSDLLSVATRIFKRFMSPTSKWQVATTAAAALAVKRKLMTGVVEADLFDNCKAETFRLLAGEKLERYAIWIDCEKAMAEFFRIRDLYKKSEPADCLAADEVFDIVRFGDFDESAARRRHSRGGIVGSRRNSREQPTLDEHLEMDNDDQPDFIFSMKDFTLDRGAHTVGSQNQNNSRASYEDSPRADDPYDYDDDDDDDSTEPSRRASQVDSDSDDGDTPTHAISESKRLASPRSLLEKAVNNAVTTGAIKPLPIEGYTSSSPR